jgi:hypothetical protein
MRMRKTEARLFEAYWQDGLLDLLAGVSVAVIGIGWLFNLVAVTAAVPAIAVVTWPALRGRITAPRLGEVKFNAQRVSGLRAGLGGALVIGLAVTVLFVVLALEGGEPSRWEQWIAPAIPALLLSFLATLVAALLRLMRFLTYAAVLFAGGLAAAMLGWEPGWSMVLAGALITAAGAMRLGRFLHEFPRLPETMS